MFQINIVEPFKPWGRAIKYSWLKYSSQFKAQQNRPNNQNHNYPPPVLEQLGDRLYEITEQI